MAGLLDFLQGASNAAASTVSGPIDLINAGLLGIGAPMPRAPFGGSQWMQDKGLTRKPKNFYAGLLGETAGNVLPIVAAAKAPQIARGLLQAGDNLRAPTPMNSATRGQAGAIVYHGSPHKFDKFDSSKIGTGEGAQAYGHGLYFADSPEVASQYQRALAHKGQYGIAFAGKSGADIVPANALEADALAALNAAIGNKSIPKNIDGLYKKAFSEIDKTARVATDPAAVQRALSLRDALQRMQLQGVRPYNETSNLYKVDLPDEQIAKMLDWDKPLSQQAPDVALALEALRDSARKSLPQVGVGDPTGRGVYTAYQAHRGGNQGAVSQRLSELGIPGIRYLDGGSRTAGTGSSNYVVFPGNEGLLSILGRE